MDSFDYSVLFETDAFDGNIKMSVHPRPNQLLISKYGSKILGKWNFESKTVFQISKEWNLRNLKFLPFSNFLDFAWF